MKFADYHNKAFAGVIEGENIGGDVFRIHIGSWWNGEGLDIRLESREGVQNLTVTGDELTNIAALAIASGYVNQEELIGMAEGISEAHVERQKRFDRN